MVLAREASRPRLAMHGALCVRVSCGEGRRAAFNLMEDSDRMAVTSKGFQVPCMYTGCTRKGWCPEDKADMDPVLWLVVVAAVCNRWFERIHNVEVLGKRTFVACNYARNEKCLI